MDGTLTDYFFGSANKKAVRFSFAIAVTLVVQVAHSPVNTFSISSADRAQH
jgi:hypothetical protein